MFKLFRYDQNTVSSISGTRIFFRYDPIQRGQSFSNLHNYSVGSKILVQIFWTTTEFLYDEK
jgi:hypothetical protein